MMSLFLAALQGAAPGAAEAAAPLHPLETVGAVSTIVLTLAVVGVLAATVGVLLQLREVTRSTGMIWKEVEKDLGPVLDRARTVAENLEFITGAVRADVQKLSQSVALLNDRLRDASDRMEERVQDFAALVEVLQSEAEEVALDAAAAARGIRAGVRGAALGARAREGPEELPPAEEGETPDSDYGAA